MQNGAPHKQKARGRTIAPRRHDCHSFTNPIEENQTFIDQTTFVLIFNRHKQKTLTLNLSPFTQIAVINKTLRVSYRRDIRHNESEKEYKKTQ